jgi:hypothetical protein
MTSDPTVAHLADSTSGPSGCPRNHETHTSKFQEREGEGEEGRPGKKGREGGAESDWGGAEWHPCLMRSDDG